ncbi:MAG: hypothetical protein JRC68_01855 [Deltaproteobacteria bacterium]|nr:hypothetical protein [Deltaproteobacteria bacterium]
MNVEGDVVLIHYQDKPALYARIEAIRQDIKKDWYQVTFLLLTLPAQTVTWILREEYINGVPFTMGGHSMVIKEVKQDLSLKKTEGVGELTGKKGKSSPAKVIPLKINKD